jgi:hypothetical protein
MKLIINWIEMNEVKKTLVGESVLGAYVTPETKVLHVQPEGVLCSSVYNDHQSFTMGDEYEL